MFTFILVCSLRLQNLLYILFNIFDSYIKNIDVLVRMCRYFMFPSCGHDSKQNAWFLAITNFCSIPIGLFLSTSDFGIFTMEVEVLFKVPKKLMSFAHTHSKCIFLSALVELFPRSFTLFPRSPTCPPIPPLSV